MPVYLLRVCLTHQTFRIPSLLSVAQTFGFEIRFLSDDLTRGILLVELAGDEQANLLLDRAILVISAARLIAHGDTYEELHAMSAASDQWAPYVDSTFSFAIDAVNHHLLQERQIQVIQSFEYVELRGKVRIKNPEVQFIIFEDYDFEEANTPAQRIDREGKFRHVYVGRSLGPSRARPLIHAHAVKSRQYYGNTAMDAEMGFLMATQALPLPGKVIYDPFVGTGSLLYACAHWGASVFGSDIDGRQMRGKKTGKGVIPGFRKAADQYGLSDRILDCLAFDVTRNPWRRGGWVDAIVTDPPYGVRAGAKRLGKRNINRPVAEGPHVLPNGEYSHERENYLPPCKPYEMVDLTYDLVVLARYMLVPGGRLVFFLPTVSDEFDPSDIPVVDGMRELKVDDGSVQSFGKWGRRLITIEKTAMDDGTPPAFGDNEDEYERVPGHHRFGYRYMKGFSDASKPSQE